MAHCVGGGLAGNPIEAQKLCGVAAGEYPDTRKLAALRAAVICLINAQRRADHLRPLAANSELRAAASAHSRDMVRHGYRAHVGSDGSTPYTRVRRYGYRPFALGEAIWDGVSGLSAPEFVVGGTMADPAHRAILLDGALNQIGVGLVAGIPSASSAGFSPGAGTYTLDLGRGLELRKLDTVTRKRRDVTSQQVRVVVGQDVDLDVVLPNGTPAPGPLRWRVAGWRGSLGRSSVVHGYLIGDSGQQSFGRPLPQADPASVQEPKIAFRFIRTGRFAVSVSTGSGTVATEFVVTRPRLDRADPARFCNVAINTTPRTSSSGQVLEPVTLGLGLNDRCADTYGVVWKWLVTGPVEQAGQLAMVQLISRHERAGELGGRLHRCGPSQDAWEADSSSFYPDWLKSGAKQVSFAGYGELDAHDAPFIHVRPTGGGLRGKEYSYAFGARDYLMYKSTEPGSIWIPLGELIWNFDATASTPATVLPAWTADVLAEPAPNAENYVPPIYARTVIAPLPEWTRAYEAGTGC